MRDEAERFTRGGNVVIVGQGRTEWAQKFCEERGVPFPCLVSSDNEAYRVYGLVRGSAWKVWGPKPVLKGIRGILPETHQGVTRGDGMQLAGTFVIDEGGIVRYAHRARDSSDNPPIDEVVAALDAVARAGEAEEA